MFPLHMTYFIVMISHVGIKMENKTGLDTDVKLKAVAYMRRSAQESRERLNHVDHILSSGSNDTHYLFSDAAENPNHEKQNESPVGWMFSFLCRAGLVLLLLVMFFVGKNGPDGKIEGLLNACKKEITVDYAENLFDFIERMPYTLNYEKINAEGRDPVKN